MSWASKRDMRKCPCSGIALGSVWVPGLNHSPSSPSSNPPGIHSVEAAAQGPLEQTGQEGQGLPKGNPLFRRHTALRGGTNQNSNFNQSMQSKGETTEVSASALPGINFHSGQVPSWGEREVAGKGCQLPGGELLPRKAPPPGVAGGDVTVSVWVFCKRLSRASSV